MPPLADATGTPDSDIFVGDIVNRIKCELAIAFSDKLNNDEFNQYQWLADWTVKVDLTLPANQQGGVTPNGSYTMIQRSAVNRAAGPTNYPGATLGTVPQLFTLGASANLGEQATRTEGVSFSLSVKEIDDMRQRDPAGFEKAVRPLRSKRTAW